jgi:putative copper export protein
MHGQGGVFDGGLIAAMVQKTMWGHGWLLQLVGIVVTGAGFHMARNAVPLSGQANRGWGIATIGVMILAFTPGLAGHAAAAPRMKALTLLADGLHVMGAGGWLGSLTMVLLAGIPAALALPEADRGPMIAELVNAFSPTALVFAGLVGTTGLFAAWIHLGSVPAIWQTRYGQLLIIKLTILSVVAVTGAYNWLRVKPTLGHVEGGVRIRRSATVEVVIGVLVLLVTAILVATPTAMDMQM